MSQYLVDRLEYLPDGGPGVNDLTRFFKEKKYRGSPERGFGALLAMKRSVPPIIGRALIEYLNERYGLGLIEEQCLEVAFKDRELGWWANAIRLVGAMATPFRPHDRMRMDIEKDPLLAARWELDSVGYKLAKPGDSLDPGPCMRRGEEKMRRTEGQYTSWIRRFLETPGYRRTFMFYLRRDRRVGMIGVFPLKQAVWERMAAGEIFDGELTPDDLQYTSRYLYNHGMSDAERVPMRDHERTFAQTRCIMYQYAYYTRGIEPFRPMILSPACCDYYRTLLGRHGYRPNGHTMKGTDTPMMVYAHKKDGGSRLRRHQIAYDLHMVIARRLQKDNRKQWLEEDKELGLG